MRQQQAYIFKHDKQNKNDTLTSKDL